MRRTPRPGVSVTPAPDLVSQVINLSRPKPVPFTDSCINTHHRLVCKKSRSRTIYISPDDSIIQPSKRSEIARTKNHPLLPVRLGKDRDDQNIALESLLLGDFLPQQLPNECRRRTSKRHMAHLSVRRTSLQVFICCLKSRNPCGAVSRSFGNLGEYPYFCRHPRKSQFPQRMWPAMHRY